MFNTMDTKIIPSSEDIPITGKLKKSTDKFIKSVCTFENLNNISLVLMHDKKSAANYIICHIRAKKLAVLADLDAVLSPDDDEEYKLNRNIYLNESAYQSMKSDALLGRSFEDIVVEFDNSYHSNKPLKVFGGQHRITALSNALGDGVNELHGVRVYFNLSIEQRLEIAIVNNTSIAISNDLLERMQEEALGSELRDWCQKVGILEPRNNFADRRTQSGIPTVRIVRTLIMNFYQAQKVNIESFYQPIIANANNFKEYETIRNSIKWDDESLNEMGKQFSSLHKKQYSVVKNRDKNKSNEFAIKAMHPTVVAAWGYATGLFQSDKSKLKIHYSLPDKATKTKDPLNAEALLNASLKGVDPDSYRGLGSRQGPQETGRMLEVFIVHADKSPEHGISKELANAAIKSYTAKKAKYDADKSLEKI